MIFGFLCSVAFVIDGDTFICSDRRHVRLAGIDAPEMPGHCRRGRVCTPGDPIASRRSMQAMVQGRTLTCSPLGKSYDRILATCRWHGIDIACVQVQRGQAVKRYSESWRVCRKGIFG